MINILQKPPTIHEREAEQFSPSNTLELETLKGIEKNQIDNKIFKISSHMKKIIRRITKYTDSRLLSHNFSFHRKKTKRQDLIVFLSFFCKERREVEKFV